MGTTLDFQSVQSNLSGAKNALVLIPANPNLDSVASGLALYLILKKQGKNVAIGCPTQMTVAFNRLIGVNKITNKIGSRNLVISFDYVKDSVEKVSYNIENDKFNLVIEPKPNFPVLDSDKVSYSYSGADADIIFIVGATKLEDLQKLYEDEKKLFADKLTINIDNKFNNSRFGKINLHDPKAASCSELIYGLIKNLNWSVDEDIATNLYAGIKANSSNFQAANVSPVTFEAAAWALQNGARKDQLPYRPQRQPLPAYQPAAPLLAQPPIAQPPLSQPPAISKVQPPAEPPAQSKMQPMAPPPPFSQQQVPAENKEIKPPPDWFKPKIYSGKRTT